MKKALNSRGGYIHLYNPREEGLGSYDVHYINANKKTNLLKIQKESERHAA